MKRTLIRMLAAVLTLVMLVTMLGVFPVTAEHTTNTQDYYTAASDAPMLAYVPLDDRPVVTDRVEYAATAAGWDIHFPTQKDWYCTRLDNQPKNSSYGTTSSQYHSTDYIGNGYQIMNWLEEMEDAGCDHYIIHLDMMFSGGLVGSRYPDHANVQSYEWAIADRLVALCEDPENSVYFLDTVMRLASTVRFKQLQQKHYDAYRSYAQQQRKDLSTNNAFKTTNYSTSQNLINQIYNNYAVTPSGVTWSGGYMKSDGSYYFNYWGGNDPFTLSADLVTKYNQFRRRKLQLINYMMQYAGESVYIIGVDDSSPNPSIQSNDIAFINQRMDAMGITSYLFADTDSLGMLAVGRCTVDYYGVQPKVYVKYFGSKYTWPADSYDTGTLQQNVTAHVNAVGGEIVSSSSAADIEMLILTRAETNNTDKNQPAYDYEKMTSSHKTTFNNNVQSMVNRINTNVNKNMPTIVMDASCLGKTAFVNSDINNFQTKMYTETDISKILGYSNWNTVGNTLGLGMGQGISRFAYLKNAEKTSPASHVAAVQSITYSYIKDIAYIQRYNGLGYNSFLQWVGVPDVYNLYATSSGKANFLNNTVTNGANLSQYTPEPWEINQFEHYIYQDLNYGIKANDDTSKHGDGNSILNQLKKGAIYTHLNGTVQTLPIKNIELARFRMPWFRSFEITFDIKVNFNDVYTADSNNMMNIALNTKATDVILNVGVQHTDSSSYFVQPYYKGTDTNGIIKTNRLPAVYKNPANVTIYKNTTALGNTDVLGTGYQVQVQRTGETAKTVYTAVVNGDVSSSSITVGDGKINTQDARDALRYVVGSIDLSDAQLQAANMDGSGSVGSNDARRILQKALGMA